MTKKCCKKDAVVLLFNMENEFDMIIFSEEFREELVRVKPSCKNLVVKSIQLDFASPNLASTLNCGLAKIEKCYNIKNVISTMFSSPNDLKVLEVIHCKHRNKFSGTGTANALGPSSLDLVDQRRKGYKSTNSALYSNYMEKVSEGALSRIASMCDDTERPEYYLYNAELLSTATALKDNRIFESGDVIPDIGIYDKLLYNSFQSIGSLNFGNIYASYGGANTSVGDNPLFKTGMDAFNKNIQVEISFPDYPIDMYKPQLVKYTDQNGKDIEFHASPAVLQAAGWNPKVVDPHVFTPMITMSLVKRVVILL